MTGGRRPRSASGGHWPEPETGSHAGRSDRAPCPRPVLSVAAARCGRVSSSAGRGRPGPVAGGPDPGRARGAGAGRQVADSDGGERDPDRAPGGVRRVLPVQRPERSASRRSGRRRTAGLAAAGPRTAGMAACGGQCPRRPDGWTLLAPRRCGRRSGRSVSAPARRGVRRRARSSPGPSLDRSCAGSTCASGPGSGDGRRLRWRPCSPSPWRWPSASMSTRTPLRWPPWASPSWPAWRFRSTSAVGDPARRLGRWRRF